MKKVLKRVLSLVIIFFLLMHISLDMNGIHLSGQKAFAVLPTCTRVTNVPVAGQGAQQSPLPDGSVILTGGYNYITGIRNQTTYLYNPITNQWTTRAALPITLDSHSQSTLNDGNVLVCGGYNGSSYSSGVYLYKPSTDTWSRLADMPEGIFGHNQSTLNDGRVLISGGQGTRTIAEPKAYIYNPSTNLWSNASPLPKKLVGHSQSTLNDGRVLVVGGLEIFDGRVAYSNSVFIYNPTTNSWSTASSLPTISGFHSQSTLPDGRVFVTGGNNGLSPVNTTYLYDPTTNSWSTSIALPEGINGHVQSSLASNRVLITSGSTNNSVNQNTYIIKFNQEPTINVIAPAINTPYSPTSTSLIPQIGVSDSDNDTLICKVFINNEAVLREIKTVSDTTTTQTVTFNSLDLRNLSEGTNTIKFDIYDGKSTPVISTVSIKVDNTPPTIGTVTTSSIVNQITISGSATDSISNIAALPYRFTIGSNITGWLSNSTYTEESLQPNTQYPVTFEARDIVGNIASQIQNVYTKAQIPFLSASNPKSRSIDLSTTDSNPDVTQYQLSINNGQFYVTAEGGLTTSPVWRTLTHQTVTITGLTPSTNYSIKAKARNQEGIETDWSAPVSGTTLIPPPNPPTELIATATTTSTTVNWQVVADATGYDLEADGNIMDTGLQTTYTHTGLTPDTQHTYRVRAKNEGGAGEWSSPITKSTLPNAPITPTNLTAIPSANSMTVMWHAVVGATAYELEVDGVKLNNGGGTNYLHTGLQPNTYHTYKVRAINSGGKSDWTEEVGAVTKVDAPGVPGNITTMPTHTQITVSWDAVDGATYDIEVDGIAKYNAAHTTYVHTGLLPGTEHSYRVRAKQSGTPGEWSQLIMVSTVSDAFGIPANLEAQVSNNQVSLSWEPVTGATGYEVEIDGLVLDNGSETSCVHDGVTPNTQYTYRVRAKNAEQTSAWSTPLSVSTYLLATPQNLSATSTDTDLTATWEAVEGATRYVIEFDGVVIESIETTTYQFHELPPVSQHKLRVRAQNDEGMGAWTNLLIKSTIGNGYSPPEKVTCVARNTALTVLWSEAPGATAYDLEVDGVLMEGITATSYLQENLVSGTPHTYRIRAVYENHTSGWTELLETQTLPYAPDVPTNMVASVKMTAIAVSWDVIDNVTDYELEVDGNIIQNGVGTTYLHESLQPDSEHTYRVRTRNLSGTSPWSEPVTTRTLSSTETYTVDCTENEVFNLVFTASNLKNLENYTFTISYDPNQLELIDLCSITPKLDTGTGNITGTDIYISQVTPGTLVIKKMTPIPPGQVWSGIVDSIKFRSKTSTQVTLTYSIQ